MASLLLPGQSLKVGEPLVSPGRTLRLIYQPNGNLELLQGDIVLWHSHTYGTPPGECVMQPHDGAFTVVDAFSQPRWSSGVSDAQYAGSRLELHDDGDLLIRSPQGMVLWSRSGLLNAPQLSLTCSSALPGETVSLGIDPESRAVALLPSLDRWQTRFFVKALPERRLQLRPLKGGYLSMAGGTLTGTSPKPGDSETFVLQPQPGRGVGLQTLDGQHYLSADRRIDPTCATTQATRLGLTETFRLTARNLAGLRLVQRLAVPGSVAYLALRSPGDRRRVRLETWIGDALRLELAAVPESRDALRLELLTADTAQLTMANGGRWRVEEQQLCASPAGKGEPETFTLEWQGERLALKTRLGRYVTLQNEKVIAGGVAVPTWFEVEFVAPGLFLTPPVVTVPPDRLHLLLARHSGKALAVAGITPGAPVIQGKRDGQPHQLLSFEPVGDGYYFVRVAHSGLVLEVKNRSSDDGADLVQNPLTGGDHQQFLPIASDNGIRLMVRHSGQVVQVSGLSDHEGASVESGPWRQGGHQQFEAVVGYLPRTVKLHQLICYRADERGGDDLYLKANGQKVWTAPQSMKGLAQAEALLQGLEQALRQRPSVASGGAGPAVGAAPVFIPGELLPQLLGRLPAESSQGLNGLSFEGITPDRPLTLELWEKDDFLRGGDDHYSSLTFKGEEPLMPGNAGLFARALVGGTPVIAPGASASPMALLRWALQAGQTAYLLLYSVG